MSSIEELVKRIERGEDPKTVVENYMVPSFAVGNRVLVQGLPSPISGKVIALKEDGDLCTIETEKGTMDVPARHLVMQEGYKREQFSPEDVPFDSEIQRTVALARVRRGYKIGRCKYAGGGPMREYVCAVNDETGHRMVISAEGYDIFIPNVGSGFSFLHDPVP